MATDTLSLPVDCYVAELDGTRCTKIKSFMSELATAMRFPDYFGNNYNAMWDCLTDLEWLDEANYAIIVNGSEHLLADEPKEEREHLIDYFERLRSNWRNVPNYPGEEEFRKKADFRFILR